MSLVVAVEPPICNFCGEFILDEAQPCPARGDDRRCYPGRGASRPRDSARFHRANAWLSIQLGMVPCVSHINGMLPVTDIRGAETGQSNLQQLISLSVMLEYTLRPSSLTQRAASGLTSYTNVLNGWVGLEKAESSPLRRGRTGTTWKPTPRTTPVGSGDSRRTMLTATLSRSPRMILDSPGGCFCNKRMTRMDSYQEFEEQNGGIQDVWGVYKEPNSPWIYGSDRNGELYVLKLLGSGSDKRN